MDRQELEKDLAKYQEMQRVNEINWHRLNALISYLQEKLKAAQDKQAEETKE